MGRLLKELQNTAGFVVKSTKRRLNKNQERRYTTYKKRTPVSRQFEVVRVSGGLMLVRTGFN